MLRTKHLGNLSNSARSFFLSGSRSGAADGTSCLCAEDETCVSKRQGKSADIVFPQETPTSVSKTGPGGGNCVSGGARGPIAYLEAETSDDPAAVPHVQADPTHSLRSDGVTSIYADVHAAQKGLKQTSLHVTDQFVKVGIATVGFLSDLMNYKLPNLDGRGLLFTPQNCMVNSTSPLSNIRSSNEKSHKRANFSQAYAKPTVGIPGESSSGVHSHRHNGQTEMSGVMRGSEFIPSIPRRTSVDTHKFPSDTLDQTWSATRREKTHPSTNLPNLRRSGKISESRVKTAITNNIKSADKGHQSTRSMRTQAGYAPFSSKSVNNACMVDQVYSILRQVRWGPAAEEALEKLNLRVDAYQANQVLKLLKDHSVALGYFYWLKRRPGFKHDEHSYTTMVGILGYSRQFGAIKRLLDEMIRDGCQPNVVTYNRLIHVYGRANYLKEAVNVFYQMQEAGCKPDRVTYCTLIDIHAKAGFLDIAMDMYRRMQQAGLSPDTFTYGVIINCLGKAGHLSAAYKLFYEMVEHGCVPNLVTYNIMIALQAKARNYPSALKLYRDMQTAGFRPDKVTYSIIMEVLGHCGCLDEAEAVFTEMKQEHWVPDEPVYGLLVDLWGKGGNVDKAQGWYQSMLKAGLRPNVPTCNSLLGAFLRASRFSDAYDLLQNMLGLGLKPSLQTYTLLLSSSIDVQSPREMSSCSELMAITGHPAHVFLLNMPVAEPDGQNVRDHTSNFLDLMHSEDRESKRGLVDAVVDFLHKTGLKEEAGSVWEVAAQKNVYPEAVREKSSSYWLINLHVMSDGTAVTALSRTLAWFHRRLLASGVGPDRIDIVTGWGRRSRVTGSSMVRQSVKDLLHLFRFPFFTGHGNSGCFIGCGDSLNHWLLHSYVERMHLL